MKNGKIVGLKLYRLCRKVGDELMRNNPKRFYLYGINGVYNYGCEAMILSISEQIRSLDSNYRVIYESSNYEYDVTSLASCENIEIEAIKPRINPINKKIIRFLRRKCGCAKPDDNLYFDTEWTRECDVLVIIGGDVFDLLPEQRTEKKYINDRLFVSQLVKNYGGKVILWGISVGDFDCNPNAKKALINYFNSVVDVAIIRDKKSYDYLKSNGVKRIYLCSDPAFIQRTIQCSGEKQNILGINLSPLSNRYLEDSLSEAEWVDKWAEMVLQIANDLDYDYIYLIPHVVNERNKRDDDYAYLEKIYKKIRYNKKVVLLPKDLGFCGIKKYLVQCDLVFAARMHCAVNAITCGVPTVFLSYSPKSVGMCEQVYADQKWVIDINQLFKSYSPEKIKWYASQVDIQREFLGLRNYELYLDAKRATDILVENI